MDILIIISQIVQDHIITEFDQNMEGPSVLNQIGNIDGGCLSMNGQGGDKCNTSVFEQSKSVTAFRT